MSSKLIFKYILESLCVYDQKEQESIAYLLLSHHSGLSKVEIIADYSIKNLNIIEKIDMDIKDLNNYYPIQYILGYIYFLGINLKVNPDALIPRPETEELVQLIINEQDKFKKLKILDIGTGTGCIALALKKHLPFCTIYAVDVSQKALDLAQKNADANHLDINFKRLDVLNADSSCFPLVDIIVSNPPYIPIVEKKYLQINLDFEPAQALFTPNKDPFLFYRKIAKLSQTILNKKGKLYFEIHEKYGQKLSQKFKDESFSDVQIIQDINEKNRFLVCDQ